MLNNNDNCRFNEEIISPILNEFIILKRLPEGRVSVLNTIPSTNQYIIDNLKYIQSGDVIVTENQTQGRGRHGKIWISPKGQSICLSMYWKLYQKLSNTMEFSVIISFIVATVLKNLGVSTIRIKKPNDLYVYNRKLAGILIEIIMQNNYISHLIIGIGINISICVRTTLEMQISKNWIGLNHIGIFPNKNILVAILVEKLRIAMSKVKYNKYLFFN